MSKAALSSNRLDLGGAIVEPRLSGALWAPEPRALMVADLHLGKSERMARRGGPLLPPYDAAATLARLEAEIAALDPAIVVSLGDAFDDMTSAARLPTAIRERLAALAAGRRWLWIAGNHDPGAPGLDGETRASDRLGPLVFRHQAAETLGAEIEISGHYHPKACLRVRGRRIARRCFLVGPRRVMLPAFGAYTGGLEASDPIFDRFFDGEALALLLGAAELTALPRRRLVREA